jgi:anti-sigma28 factor (negative regulator of flagellin synthesis)
MKIYDVNLTGASAGSGRTQETQRAGSDGSLKSGGAASGAGDRIELSDALHSVGRAMSAYSSGRAVKVKALTAQYRSGNYRADSLATSRGMITEALAQKAG